MAGNTADVFYYLCNIKRTCNIKLGIATVTKIIMKFKEKDRLIKPDICAEECPN